MQLNGRNIVVFDLEIKKSIGVDGIGWRDYDKLGISVGCTYSFQTNEYKVYMDDNIEELVEQIEKAELAVGFNTLGFDVPLIEGTLNTTLKKEHHYDILYHSRQAFGGGDFAKGFKLDNHLAGTFGRNFMKTGNGEMAPIWWQEKKLGKLITYCLDDVKREAKLFQYIWLHGKVCLDTHGEIIFKRLPQTYLREDLSLLKEVL